MALVDGRPSLCWRDEFCRRDADSTLNSRRIVRLLKTGAMDIMEFPRSVAMFGLRKRNREQHRYYLLPGMGKCNKRRYKQWVRRSFIVGIIVSAIFGYLIYHFNRY
jgi:hypothetical protein